MKEWLRQGNNRPVPVEFVTLDEAWEIVHRYGGWRGVVRTCAAVVLVAWFWSTVTLVALCLV